MAKILVLNGPNLNLLGQREPGVYGSQTLDDVVQTLSQAAAEKGHSIEHLQSNHEGVLVDRIQQAASDQTQWVIINPGALTHTSVALRDAFLGTGLSFTEVHISNIHAREAFRHHSYLSDVAHGVIVGFGTYGYQLALQAAHEQLT